MIDNQKVKYRLPPVFSNTAVFGITTRVSYTQEQRCSESVDHKVFRRNTQEFSYLCEDSLTSRKLVIT